MSYSEWLAKNCFFCGKPTHEVGSDEQRECLQTALGSDFDETEYAVYVAEHR